MYKAMDIAYWFLYKNFEKQKANIASNEDYEVYDGITHFKLQGLLYNAQGCSLAMNNEPLFSETIDAWENSPVIENIYDSFCVFRQSPIILPYSKEADDAISKIDKDAKTKSVLEFVYVNFMGYTAWELNEMAKEENSPWAKTETGKEINQELLKDYFKKEMIEE